MRKMQSAFACAAGILVASLACAAQPTSPSYSHAKLKKMISEAHTSEQYQALATYFSSQEESYRLKAAIERQEWHRRSQGYAAIFLKYPRPADSLRFRYEYLSYEAQRMDAQATHYQELATNAQR